MAIRIDPIYEVAINNKAEALRMQGRNTEAIPLYRRLVELAPDDPDYRAGLAEVMAETTWERTR